jgi:SpoVK/Ycf46/Vps4 family AAA+-type ATPase
MDELSGLREALRFSPNNVKLRALIAAKLMAVERYEEAEEEYRLALKIAPQDKDVFSGLAGAFFKQGKHSQALVIAEKLVAEMPLPEYRLLLAKILLKCGRQDEAKSQYATAVNEAPELCDDELTQMFGNVLQPTHGEFSDDDLVAEPLGGFAEVMPEVHAEVPKTNFERVGGMDAVKETIRMKIIYPLQNKEMFAAYGKKIGGGVLMYGPPGCGKTLLARATAGEIRAKFIPVGLHDVLDMYIGQSEKQLHEIFETARRNTPCVLFFDEVDALAAKRIDMRQSASRHIINQFLSELDGVDSSNDGVLVLAATNAPWHVDSAFRRPGRFDRILFVPPPDAKARETIWRIHLAGKPCDKIDYAKLAAVSKGFSGADIEAAVEQCIEETLSEAMRLGRQIPLTQKSLAHSAGKVKSSCAEWFATAKNYATYANESGVYDDVIEYTRNRNHD